jgi:hypothetical protein
MNTTDQAPAADDHGGSGAPADAVIKRGYEEDGYDAKSVMSVPILVIGFFVLAFGTVTIMFAYFRESPVDPMANPLAVEDNSRDLNARIASTPERGRPEPLKMRETRYGDPRAITQPALAKGNPPEYHPEDIRPSPKNTPTLYETKWVVEGKFAQVTLDEAKAMALKLPNLLKARKDAERPRASYELPTPANAGRVPVFGEPEKPKKEGKQ